MRSSGARPHARAALPALQWGVPNILGYLVSPRHIWYPLHSTSVERIPTAYFLLVMKIKWSLDINTGAVERSEAARARSLAGVTVGGAKYPSIFGVGVPIILRGCQIS